MANRTVSVNLVANIGQYVSGMNAAAGATMRLGETANSSSRTARSAFDIAGKGAVLMGAAVVGGMALAVSKSMEFEKAMSAAAAATMVTGAALGDLRDAAMKAGSDTQYSATEAAQAITEMGKAGVSTADILGGGLNGALALAAAGQLDVAEAAEIASVAMTQFKLEGDKLPHVADLLAAGAGKAMGSVGDLGMALNQAGLVASSTGLSIEETTGTLAAFASAGLIGSDAGTSFRSMLQHLQNPSKESAEAMADLGISLYDAQGQFVGMEGLAGQLKTSMANLTPAVRDAAMAQIFGSDAVRAANVLYSEGADGIADWTAKVNDQGYAAEQAAKLNDNLAGDLEKLGGAFDTLMISMGSGAQGPLRFLVQGFTSLLDGISDLGGPLKSLGGFIADNKEIAIALATVLAVQLVGGITAVTVAFNRMVLAPAVLGLSGVLGAALNLPAAFAAASGAVAGFMAAVAPLAAVGAVVYAITKTVDFATAAGDARKEIAGMWDAVADARGAEQINALSGYVDHLATKVRSLNEELPKTEGAFEGLLAPLGMLENGGTLNAWDEYEAALRRAKERQEEVSRTATTLAERFHLTRDEVIDLAGRYGVDLTTGLSEAGRLFEDFYTAEYGTTPNDAADATGAAMTSAKQRTEEAAAALEDWLETLQEVSAGFVEPLATYSALVEAAATKTAEQTSDASDSWRDYASDVDVSLDELATRLEEQLLAQDNWRANIATITQRGGLEVGQILAGMGEEGVQLAADMANGTDAEFNRMADLLIEDARRGGAGAAQALDQEMKVMAAIGAAGASATAWSISEQLGIGVGRVAEIAAQYGLNLAMGVDPLLAALGKPGTVGRMASAQSLARQRGLYDGGYTGDGGKYEPKGIVHGGEYVLTKEQTARLGIDRIEEFANNGYANGGFVTAADVPRPSSTAPYGPPISTAGDATMQRGFDETVAWMRAHIGVAGTGAVGGAWGSLWQLVKSQIPGARINSTFRAGDPGYHGRGKAIDFGYGSGPGGAGSAGLASINRLLHDQVGRNLAELIYDGISDDRPDLKNGRPLTYSKATQKQHTNHVHAAVYDQGGPLYPGLTLAYNGTGKTEWVSTAREFSGAGGAGSGGRSGPVNVQVQARVFVGDREITDIVRVEASAVYAAAGARNELDGRSSRL